MLVCFVGRTTITDNGLTLAEVGEFYVPSAKTSVEQRTNVQDKFKGTGCVFSAGSEAE